MVDVKDGYRKIKNILFKLLRGLEKKEEEKLAARHKSVLVFKLNDFRTNSFFEHFSTIFFYKDIPYYKTDFFLNSQKIVVHFLILSLKRYNFIKKNRKKIFKRRIYLKINEIKFIYFCAFNMKCNLYQYDNFPLSSLFKNII